MKAIKIIQELIETGQNVTFLEDTLKEAIKEHNDFIEWLKKEAKVCKTWAEHTTYMRVLKEIEMRGEVENETI